MMDFELPEEDTFKILIATDNHLGYAERNPILEQDSFRAFEEILQLAKTNNVDFILLGGDLFHDCQPSSHSLNKCSELLKKYCFGDKPVAIEFLSDQSEHFKHLATPVVNYEDPNINVSIPVFSIHGNHDSPSGKQLISPLDILSSNGLINYFGRITEISEVEIRPILLRKGKTKIALYGLSHIPDQRLARLFKENKVKIPRLEGDDWCNILVLHQNRADRGSKNYIPADVIPDFMHLVIWGHEHDCEVNPVPNNPENVGFYIYQPGSSVATSLSEGESLDKHVGMLIVHECKFKNIPLKLKSVRPFMFDEMILCKPESNDGNLDLRQQAINDVKEKLEEMLTQAAQKQKDSATPQLLPLICLHIKYKEEGQVFNAIKLGHEYEGKVANPDKMLKLIKYLPTERQKKGKKMNIDDDDFLDVGADVVRVEDVVQKYFEDCEEGKDLSVLSAKLMIQAVTRFVDVGDNDALRLAYESQVNKTVDKLVEKDPDVNELKACVKTIKEERLRNEDKELAELLKEFESDRRGRVQVEDVATISDDEMDIDNATVTPAKPTRGRGSRGGRGARGPRASRARATRK